jgi:hypothetical protein
MHVPVIAKAQFHSIRHIVVRSILSGEVGMLPEAAAQVGWNINMISATSDASKNSGCIQLEEINIVHLSSGSGTYQFQFGLLSEPGECGFHVPFSIPLQIRHHLQTTGKVMNELLYVIHR